MFHQLEGFLMNSFNIDSSTRHAIIDSLYGVSDPGTCSLPRIMDRKEAIRQKYAKMDYFNQLHDKNNVHLQCLRLNSGEILRIMGGATIGGGIVGAVIGSLIANAPGAVFGGGVGCGIGAGAGVAICYKKELHINKDFISTFLKKDNDYLRFKQAKTDEQYKLFCGFFKNYVDGKSEKHENDLEDCLCSLTYMIPEYPVFSIYDTNRLHVYEKADIEAYITTVKEKMKAHLSAKKIEFPMSSEVITENYELALSSDPFRMHPISHKDLIYDPLFSKRVIHKLTNVLKDLQGTVEADQDPIIVEGVRCLIHHYRKQYSEMTDTLIDKLRDDIFSIDGNFKLAKQASKDMRNALNKV